ncbi:MULTISPECIES: SMI1/KNR4 family protein [Grimontia]|uniref:SMI1 / KNR4 family protein n=1 Tax=Grimontia marina TaxID=646534 RepID=A0A128FG45_9GAMM|nr:MULTISPECIES: SMI1/KNR4 family protein [Grimontia]WRW00792.1 SMI1/KNR4 family protein [Grimontia sp. NTOU-MAR1]CZF85777.1 SMI1 / KNR4 family protein [Grimontia marina]
MPSNIETLSQQIVWKPIDAEDGETPELFCSTEEQVLAVEAFLNTKLPQDYRWFLRNVGRRLIEDQRIEVRVNGISLEFLDWFRDAVDVLTFTMMASDVDDDGDARIPPNLVVMESSISRDLLLLDVSENNYGKVWYMNGYQGEKDWSGHNYEGLVLLADSFTELLEKIVQYEPN